MKKQNVMIIGAGGSLGRNLCDLLISDNYNVVAVDISENNLAYLHRMYNVPIYIEDLQKFNKLVNIIKYEEIDLVVNCAALKHVKWCEENIKRAIDINIVSNLELINYLKKNDKKFIYISSDKAINPKNIYALTKQFTDYMVEMYKFKLIRGVNFINSQGSVLDIWEQQRIYNKPFTVNTNLSCRRYFITISQMSNEVKKVIEEWRNETEYFPDIVYDICIYDLFKAYLKINKIIKYKMEPIKLLNNEKLIEDLGFNPKIIILDDINDIMSLIK